MKHDVEMAFGEHLEELRRRLIYALLGLGAAAVLCGIFYKDLQVALLRPYKRAYDALIPKESEAAAKVPKAEERRPAPPLPPGSDPALAAAIHRIEERLAAAEKRLDAPSAEPAVAGTGATTTTTYSRKFPPPHIMLGSPLSGYVTTVLLCLIAGVMIASPWILYQIWAFVSIGLRPRERQFVYTYGPMSFLLFVGGGVLFYFYLLPVGLAALMSPTANIVIDNVAMIDAGFLLRDYFNFVAMMTLVFGLVFETPLVIMFLARTEIVPLRTLVHQQKVVILIMTILAAVLTPTQDPVSMIAMGLPLIGLYELGLLMAWLGQRRAQREAQAVQRS